VTRGGLDHEQIAEHLMRVGRGTRWFVVD